MVQGAAKVFAIKIFLIEEDAGLIYFLCLAVVVVTNFRDVEFLAFVGEVVVLPHLWGKFFSFLGDAGFILFGIVIGTIAAATIVRHFFIDTLAAIAENAVPVRGEPG